MIQSNDLNIVSEIVIGVHITHLLETARIMIEKVKNNHEELIYYIKISYRDGEKSFESKYYIITTYKDTNEILQEMERWIRLFIKDNSDIDFTNGAFKNFKLYIL